MVMSTSLTSGIAHGDGAKQEKATGNKVDKRKRCAVSGECGGLLFKQGADTRDVPSK
jgi:hypothetical protein